MRNYNAVIEEVSISLPPHIAPRCCHRSVFMDPYIVLFAGEDMGEYFQDLHVFNTITEEWFTPKSLQRPIARTQHALVYRKATNTLIVLYGFSTEGNLSDILECSIRDNGAFVEWKILLTEGDIPPAVCGHSVVYHEKSDSLILFGGGRHGVYQNTPYILDIKKSEWKASGRRKEQKIRKRNLSTHDHDLFAELDNRSFQIRFNANSRGSFQDLRELSHNETSHLVSSFANNDASAGINVDARESVTSDQRTFSLSQEESSIRILDSQDSAFPLSSQISHDIFTTTGDSGRRLSESRDSGSEYSVEFGMDSLQLFHLRRNVQMLRKMTQSQDTSKPVAPPRGRHTAIMYKDNEMIVYGGFTGEMNAADCWKFHVQEEMWEEMRTTGDVPPPRSNHDAMLVGDFMYVYGGDSQDMQTLFSLDLRTNIWSCVRTNSSLPRWGHSSELIIRGDIITMYIIAGCNQQNFLQLPPTIDVVRLKAPKSLCQIADMKQCLQQNNAFSDCVITCYDANDSNLQPSYYQDIQESRKRKRSTSLSIGVKMEKKARTEPSVSLITESLNEKTAPL